MKVAKIRKKEEKKVENNVNEYSAKKIVSIFGTIILILVIFYFITVLLVNNKKETNNDNSVSVIDSSKIILSQLLDQKHDEYYVLATKASLYGTSYMGTDYISLYNSYINEYKQKEESLIFYYVDLDNALNKKYVTENINITDDIESLELNNEVLFKIKNGKIEKYYVGKTEILDKLSRL